MLAQSYSVAVPSEAATAFVNNLNQLITETTTANNQRKKDQGQTAAGLTIPNVPENCLFKQKSQDW